MCRLQWFRFSFIILYYHVLLLKYCTVLKNMQQIWQIIHERTEITIKCETKIDFVQKILLKQRECFPLMHINNTEIQKLKSNKLLKCKF